LAQSFTQLAAQCDAYTKLPHHYDSTFLLDRHLAAFLRDEASAMAEFVRDADPRRHGMFTMANHHLMVMMPDIKTITGSFQDNLTTDFLNGVVGVRVSCDQLKKMRTRYGHRAATWQAPRYFARPASRIVLQAAGTTEAD
jgi:hypothetical protein